jgi:hypothetical protein
MSSLAAGFRPRPIKNPDMADKAILCELLPLCTPLRTPGQKSASGQE